MGGLKFGWAHLIVASVIGALLAYLFSWVPRPTGKAGLGDWVAFSGNLFGAGLAVFGALYVESRKRHMARSDQRAFLIDALQHLRAALRVAGRPGSQTLQGRQGEARVLLELHAEAQELIHFAVRTSSIDSARVFLAMRRMTTMLDANQDMLERETAAVLQHATSADLESYDLAVRYYSEDAIPEIDAAISIIRSTA